MSAAAVGSVIPLELYLYDPLQPMALRTSRMPEHRAHDAGRRPVNDGNRIRKCADSRTVSRFQRRRRCTSTTRISPGLATKRARGVVFTKMSMYSLLSVSLKFVFLLCGGDSYRYFRRFWPGDSAGMGSGGFVGGESTVCSS